jgi:O-antigen/teichoic acid export membrane protein
MADKNRLGQWLWGHRNSARMAFMLSMGTRLATSMMAMVWIRALVGAMGLEMYGVYSAFQKVVSLGGLGDLGMGGAVGIRTGQLLGQRNDGELQRFLATARAVFLAMALVTGVGMAVCSLWLPGWLKFPNVPGAGSLTLLFAVGAAPVAAVLLSSYLGNVNYACGNVTWPIVPVFILLQVGTLGHWLLARQQQPLYIQFLPYVATAVLGIWLTWFYIRTSNPPLARLLPLAFDGRLGVSLFEGSFWVYLCSLGNVIYRSTDALVINAGFKPGTQPIYENNYKFCEIAVFLVLTASFVSMPKITQWMSSPEPSDQERVRTEMRRLNQFQTVLGCGAALAYLAGNNIFMKVWWLHSANPIPPAELILQMAFALNLAVTASGDAGVQLALRSGKPGLRFAGAAIGITGLLNVVLSIVAMRMGSLLGIAMATVLAQSLLSLAVSAFTCRYLKMAWVPWMLRGWLFPLAGIALAAWLRMKLPMDSWQHVVLLVGAYGAMLVAAAWALGINSAFIKDELKIVKSFIR